MTQTGTPNKAATTKPRRKKGPPKTMGRPPLLTEATRKRMVDLVKGGNYPETSAAMAGVSRPTLRSWLRDAGVIRTAREEGKRSDRSLTARERLLLDFLTELEAAQGEAEARDVNVISRAAAGIPAITDAAGKVVRAAVPADWRPAAWMLEHRNRDRWGPKVEVSGQVAVGGVDGKPIEIVIDSWAGLARFSEGSKVDKG